MSHSSRKDKSLSVVYRWIEEAGALFRYATFRDYAAAYNSLARKSFDEYSIASFEAGQYIPEWILPNTPTGEPFKPEFKQKQS